MPSAISTKARHKAWPIIRRRGWPAALRPAMEKARATPTRNEKAGWMTSCKEQPTQGTCSW